MERKIDSIVFDLGGVFVDWNPRYLYRKLIDREDRMEWFLSNVCTQAWNEQQDAGRPFAEAVRVLVEKYPEQEPLIRAYDERWLEMIGGLFTETVELLAQLRNSEVALFALSNWSSEKFSLVRDHYSFLKWFDGVVVSGDVGLKKPDPAIFRHVMELWRLTPSRSVFVDDTLENIHSAEGVGLRTIRFTSARQLEDELRALGIELLS
jgi:2-haloacid dehalogenase